MNPTLETGCKPGQLRKILIWNVTRLVFGIALAVVLSEPTFAQYPGGTPGSSGGYGSSGKSIGIAAGGVAGASVGILYWMHHHSGAVTGCVQQSSDGWTLLDEKKKQTYFLLPGTTVLKPGERIALTGKKLNYGAGAQFFQVKKVVKHLGDCAGPSNVTSR